MAQLIAYQDMHVSSLNRLSKENIQKAAKKVAVTLKELHSSSRRNLLTKLLAIP